MSELDSAVLADLQAIVGADRVLVDETSLETYGRDWTREELAAIVASSS